MGAVHTSMAQDEKDATSRKKQQGCGKRCKAQQRYLDEKIVALARDNSFFVKPSAAGGAVAPGLPQRPPYSGAKNYPVADKLLDDTDALRRLIIETARLMPAPQAKARSATGRRRDGKPVV